MKKVKYIGFYDIDSSTLENRVKSQAAVVNKMIYLASLQRRVHGIIILFSLCFLFLLFFRINPKNLLNII